MDTLYVLGEPFSISDARKAYNEYRLMFRSEADKAIERFHILYQRNRNIDDVINNVPNQAEQAIQPVVERCVKILIQHDVVTIDEAGFREQYPFIQDMWCEAFLKVRDQYAEIVLDQKALDEYRVARRKSRGRWRGGGFGVSGALKGAATAGAMNMAAGAGHMVFNGMGKIVSSISASSKKSKIYQNPNTYSVIAQGVWDAVFYLHYALVDCLDRTQADPLPLAGTVNEDDIHTAAAILNNAKSMQEDEQCRAAMLQAFQRDPYQEEWYRFALKKFGDQDGKLADIERYFGLTVVNKAKTDQIEDFAKSLPIDTEEQAQSAAHQVEQLKADLHYSGETPQTKQILEAVKRFDKLYRTVEDTTFNTRDEADFARKELLAIQKIEEQIDYASLASIEEGIQKAGEYSSIIADHHRQALQQKWDNLDKQLRTVQSSLSNSDAILCENVEIAAQMRGLDQKLSQKLSEALHNQETESALLALQGEWETHSKDNVLYQQYLAEIHRNLAQIDLNLRTAHGKEYGTREAAQAARETYLQIKSDFKTINPKTHADQFRERINSADFSEGAKGELLSELFQLENATKIKTAKTFSNVSMIILLTIVIASYFFSLSGTASFAQKDVVVLGTSLMVKDVEIVNSFTFMDGLKNGLVVFGRCFGDMFVNGFFDYIAGFHRGLIGNILWLFLGFFWVIIKQFIILIPRYLVSLVTTFFQQASLTYYFGYIVGSAVPLAVSQLQFSDDDQEGNVKRLKGWTPKKVLCTIVIILIIAAVSAYFILSGQ